MQSSNQSQNGVNSLKNLNGFISNESDDFNQQMEIDQSSITLNENNDKEIIRLIQQYLNNHGYQEVAQILSEKSKVQMEDQQVNTFRQKILSGEYFPLKGDQYMNPIESLNLSNEKQKEIEYYLYEQYYLELMEKGLKMEAIQILQRELMPRTNDRAKLHQLAQLITCDHEIDILKYGNYKNELRQKALWLGSEEDGRQALLNKIQKLMPSFVMMQPHRLEHLFKQAIAQQVSKCKFHNVYQNQYSLLEDHMCSKQILPSKCIAVLKKHKDEVWAVQFSQSGKRMASYGKDNFVYLWGFTQLFDQRFESKSNSKSSQFLKSPYKYRIKCTHEIRAHQKQINSLNWTNTDDRWLVTSSHDMTAKIWDSRSGKLVCELSNKHTEGVTCAIFSSDDSKVITASTDRLLILWEIRQQGGESGLSNVSASNSLGYQGYELTRIETRCYLDLAISSSRLVAKGQNHLHIFNIVDGDDCLQETFEDNDQQYEIETADKVFRVALSKDGRYLLANISFDSPRIEMYDLNRREIVRRFKGHKQNLYLLKCDFGGVNESFVICGSDDGCVYVWSKEKGDLVIVLGQSQTTSLTDKSKSKGHKNSRKRKLDQIQSLQNNEKTGEQDLGYHNQVVNYVNWCPSDQFILASCSDDQTIRIWGLEEMKLADVVIDNKDIKKIDGSNALNGESSQRQQYNGDMLEEEDEDDDDDEDDEDEDMEDSEDSSEQERGTGGARAQAHSLQVRIQQIDEEYEDDDDWAEGSNL